MTMEQTEQAEIPVADTAEPAVEQQVDVPVENTVTDQVEGIATPDPISTPPAVTEPAPAATAPVPDIGSQPQYTPEQLAQMQRASAEYEQVRQRAALQKQANEYKNQLEAQGYLPEQADQISSQYMQSQEYQATLVQQAENYGRHIQEKQQAVEFFVNKYNLGIGDMGALRAYDDPKSMDDAAKAMSANRERDAELARLKQAQVPAQSFDNSQGNPQVAADEGSWLSRYNSGDRTAPALAAAKKAAGLG
jgi:hypothetical protein